MWTTPLAAPVRPHAHWLRPVQTCREECETRRAGPPHLQNQHRYHRRSSSVGWTVLLGHLRPETSKAPAVFCAKFRTQHQKPLCKVVQFKKTSGIKCINTIGMVNLKYRNVGLPDEPMSLTVTVLVYIVVVCCKVYQFINLC